MKRILSRTVFHIFKFLISLISLINHRFYMRLYLPLLKHYGLKLNGTPRYIGKDVVFDNIKNISLGDKVTISNECFFLTHDYSITTGLRALNKNPKSDAQIIRNIVIEDNVFIGKRSIIMPGTIIEKNVIVGAGSVVRGIIKSDSIIFGNPSVFYSSISNQEKKWDKFLEDGLIHFDE